jgi:hypothetical protein
MQTHNTPRTWHRIDDAGAFRIAHDPDTLEPFVDGLVLLGPVTSDRVRGLNLRTMSSALPALDVPGDAMPTEQDMRTKVGTEAGLRIITTGTGGVLAIADGQVLADWQPRDRSDLSAGDWYRDTAALYRLIENLHPGSPTKALAEYAQVNFSTAVYWIRECRRRGLLPKSAKQLGKPKGAQA